MDLGVEVKRGEVQEKGGVIIGAGAMIYVIRLATAGSPGGRAGRDMVAAAAAVALA